jgi:hypothetical protein
MSTESPAAPATPPVLIPAPPAPVPAERSGPTWMSLLMWLLGSVGLTGLLAVCGFVLNTASEDFWGYHLGRDASAADYVALFGELVFAAFTAVLQWSGERWWHLPLVLVLLGAAVVALLRVPDRWYHPRVLFLALGVAALVNFAWTDVPTFFVRDMLMDVGLSSTGAADGMTRTRAEALRERHICSRLSEGNIRRNEDAVLDVACSAARPPARYAQALRNGFILNVMLALVNLLALVAGAMWVLGGGGREYNRTRRGRAWRLALVTSAGVMVMDLFNVPYHYAKTARRTEVHRVTVQVDVEGDALATRRGFLLADGDSRLVMYDEERLIWALPQDRVVSTVLGDPYDVLRDHVLGRIPPRTP